MQWPVRPAELLQDFDAPAQVWLPGHRGVDVDADSGMLIFAPQGGTIVFSGRVAHKDVVVIEHAHGWRSTFEPAITTLSVGTKVQRGQSIAQISDGGSDHCQDACLHWGVKIDKKRYLNPRLLTEVRPITILPLLE
ncbi:M23 family metallopeptidase [Alloscardovia criceti]|uniref:M23 family metallopeptidase n=1 Tax=Alloscardovia criceti TaxID=356828 RepID=UPI00035D9A81|nr:M23 family metallopeptidase [Alloscardovia criceti]